MAGAAAGGAAGGAAGVVSAPLGGGVAGAALINAAAGAGAALVQAGLDPCLDASLADVGIAAAASAGAGTLANRLFPLTGAKTLSQKGWPRKPSAFVPQAAGGNMGPNGKAVLAGATVLTAISAASSANVSK